MFWPVPALRPNYTRPVQTALLNSIDGAPPTISQPEPVDQQGTAKTIVAPVINRCSSFFIQASNQMVFKPFSVPTIVCLQSIDFSVSALDHWTTGPGRQRQGPSEMQYGSNRSTIGLCRSSRLITLLPVQTALLKPIDGRTDPISQQLPPGCPTSAN